MAGSLSSSRSMSNLWSILKEEEAHHSPIRYRIGSLDYQPPIYCKCGNKAVLWISWRDDNPGRRYLKCYKAREGGCDFLGWYEGPVDAFVQTLLVDLRNEVWTLKKQRAFMKQTVKEAIEKIEEQDVEFAEMKKGVARLDQFEGEKEYLKGKVNKLELEKNVLMAVCIFLLAVAVLMYLG